ncbi:MAG: choice-of-anchor B family protein [Saprospirales bacterium]|nr:MAG: choice-of-anchor B family protein [Saprospirales bacterium]
MHKKLTTLVLFSLMLSVLSSQQNFNLEFVGNLDYPENASDVWGYVGPDSTEYAIMGVRNGTAVIDLSDPANPEEFLFVSGANSIWRDMKTWDNYIYAVADQGVDGLLIIDMSNAPDTAEFKFWQPSITIGGITRTLNRCHNMWIDEDGYAYLSGCNMNSGGVIIIDLHSDPWNPDFVAAAQNKYSHDNYVRDSMLYSAEIYQGVFSIQDITDRTNPQFVNDQTTTSSFTHNCWKSDNGNYIFTTDEVAGAFVDAYDISDPLNIQYLSSFRPKTNESEGVIPHNVHYHNGYLVVSWYTDGVIIVDAHRPENMVKVGQYDTYPGPHGGFAGCWGAFPYLPSGLVLASDIQTGLYVLEPTYVRASYLEGKVISAIDSSNIPNVLVEIQTDFPNGANTGANGLYKTGLAEEGFFNVLFSHPDYQDTIIYIELERTEVIELNVALSPPVCTPPTIQAHSLSKHQTIGTEVELNWSRGNGDRMLIIAREGADVNVLPSNGQQYLASDTFSMGHDFGMGNYTVYDGTGTQVTISNLELDTEYYFALFEYSLIDHCYLLPPLYGSLLTLPETADIALQKLSDRDSVEAGDSVQFTFIITNSGPYESGQITLIDSLPDELEYINSSPPASQDSNVIEWTFNNLLPGDTITAILTTMVGGSLSGDRIQNFALATSETLDDNPDNNFDSALLFVDCSLFSCENILAYATEIDCGAWVDFEPHGCNFSSGDFFEVGNTQVNCFFDDSCGLPDSCSFLITVIDTISPQIENCPQHLVFVGCDTDVLANPPFSDSLSSVDYTQFSDSLNLGVAFDNCGISHIQYQDSLFVNCTLQVFRTWVISDEEENYTSCLQEIEIQFPILSVHCPADTVLTACTQEAVLENAFDQWLLLAELSGGCEPSLIHDGVFSSVSCGGSLSVTFNAVDSCGQQAQCQAIFQVENVSDLILKCPADTVLTACTQEAVLENAFDQWLLLPELSGGCEPSLIHDGVFSSVSCGGLIQVSFAALDSCGQQLDCVASFEVEEQESLSLLCPESQMVEVGGLCEFSVNGSDFDPVVSQICDDYDLSFQVSGSIEDSGENTMDGYLLSLGIFQILWIAEDQCSVDSCSFTLEVIDGIAPELVCPDSIFADAGTNCFIPVPNFINDLQFADNCTDSSNLQYNQVPAAGLNITQPISNIFITITDESGNSSNCTFALFIENFGEPIQFDCDPGVISQPTSAGDCFSVVSYSPVFSGGCLSNPIIVNSLNGESELEEVEFTAGIHQVVFLLIEHSDTISACTIEVEIMDQEPPEIICPSDTVIYIANDTCIWEFDFNLPQVSDNCAVDSSYWSAHESYSPGIHSVAFYAFDESGNSSICSLNLQIVDSISPEISCPSPVEMEIPFGQPEAYIELELAIADDNCGMDFIQNTYNNGGSDASDVYPLGTTFVSFTATDINGNTASCMTQVELTEGEPPPQVIILGGQISTPFGLLPPSAEFKIKGAIDTLIFQDLEGNFEVTLNYGDSISLSAHPDGDWLDGVTTLDLILIQRKILQLDTFYSPYQHIAADANRDLVISTFDLVLIQNLILGEIDSIEGNHSWNSIPTDFEFEDPTNPLGDDWPEIKLYPFLTSDLPDEDWVAVKTGDVSGDAGESVQRISAEERGLFYESRISGGDGILSFFFHQNDVSISGFQLALELPSLFANDLKFVPGSYFEKNGVAYQYLHDNENGKFRLLAYAAKEKPIPAGQPFFELLFRQSPGFEHPTPKVTIPHKDMARFESKMYTEGGKVYLIKMRDKEKLDFSYDLRLSPNPFSQDLKIVFDLPEDLGYDLEILDASGKSIWKVSKKGFHGKNELNLHANDIFPTDGLYIISLQVEEKVVTESVIRQRR